MGIECYYDSLGNFASCGYIGFMPSYWLMILFTLLGVCIGSMTCILINLFYNYDFIIKPKKNKQ